MQFLDRNNAATAAAALRLQENCLRSASLWLFVRPFSIVFDNQRWTFDVAREWHVFFTPGCDDQLLDPATHVEESVAIYSS